MDLKLLKTFQLLANYGSFIRVAEEMNYAQSTVTIQIQKLESDLGVQLIERGKKIRLTEAGRLFHEQSLQIVKNMEQLQTNLSDFRLGESGNIRLGVTEPTASYRLPDILKRFLFRYPKIRISVNIANTPTLSEQLLKGDIDIALCSAPNLDSVLYFEPLFKEKFVVLMPENHPLAQKAAIAPEDIRGHRLLITSATCPYRKKLEMMLQESGNISLDTMEIGSMMALKYYVESGLGIALVPNILLKTVPIGTTVRTISGSPIDMISGILVKTSDYPLNLANSKLYQFFKHELYERSVL
ncbi:LysR family transcriptional regulator [Aneurinibacillus sp. Ricciae_BoGa-3]|uniref:LysR family transcriptional regulator n=1 Tax=Aneurinibacillus sp. Ricciae_BoGa-3 TaxID=3022697 RepID=UPI00233FAAAA|nr:LysR family transcriptional regulator [Aneurinibacillus sp. Ricciae_BoGa-3]WCK55052.1 LysR family transcriptional regulator [Aneurinibacillus sp. Ricciae_BoGa-3]